MLNIETSNKDMVGVADRQVTQGFVILAGLCLGIFALVCLAAWTLNRRVVSPLNTSQPADSGSRRIGTRGELSPAE